MLSRVPLLALALSGCLLDFDAVGPGAGATEPVGGQGGLDPVGAGGVGSGGADPTGGTGGEPPTPPVIHDCSNLPDECVAPPTVQPFVLVPTCSAPLWTGGVGHDAGALTTTIECNCSCDCPCAISLFQHPTDECKLDDFGSFQLYDGQCTDSVAAFNDFLFHSVGEVTTICTDDASPEVPFKRPIAACTFASEGCEEGDVCLSTSAPVCVPKTLDVPCPLGFEKVIEVLKEDAAISSCSCACDANPELCPPTALAGANCAGTTPTDCTKADAFHYDGEVDGVAIQTITSSLLRSDKLCCDKALPPL